MLVIMLYIHNNETFSQQHAANGLRVGHSWLHQTASIGLSSAKTW